MRFATIGASALALALLSATAGQAQELETSANIGIVSDYVFRGFTQSDEDPAFQGGLDATYGSFYAGGWASAVDFGDGTDAEFDAYGGVRGEAGGFAWDAGVVGYFYLSAPGGADYDYVEFKGAVSRAVGPVSAGAAVYYSPDFFGADEKATYAEVNGAWAFHDKLSLTGAVGKQWLDVNDDYTTWNLGVAYAATDNIALDFRYHDTDVDGPLSDDRFVVSLKFFN